jgi:putative transposase
MVAYRRSRIPNAPYFLTVVLRDRGSRLLLDHLDQLRGAFRCAATAHPFQLDAVVILPDHFHLLCTLPDGDADFSARVQVLKRRFTFGLVRGGVKVRMNERGEADVWQHRFREHTIRDDDDFARHVAYIHFNPVKHGLVGAVRDWPHSSFHRYVRQGLVQEDWGGGGEPLRAEPATPVAE